MRIFLLIITLLSWVLNLYCQFPDGEEILKKVDANMYSESSMSTSRMIIQTRRGSKTMKIKSWVKGEEKSFSEYLSPPKDAGTKMLKLEDDLWIYDPDADRSVQISGHLLRQSVMGSDLSYEDLMEEAKLYELYEAIVTGEEKKQQRSCWILELKSRKSDEAYKSRKVWIDKDRFLPLQEERYGKSGKLLKKTVIEEVKKIGERWYPIQIYFKDMLKSGDGTYFIIDEIEFEIDIPAYRFTKAALRN